MDIHNNCAAAFAIALDPPTDCYSGCEHSVRKRGLVIDREWGSDATSSDP